MVSHSKEHPVANSTELHDEDGLHVADSKQKKTPESTGDAPGEIQYNLISLAVMLSTGLIGIAVTKLWLQTRQCLEKDNPFDRYQNADDALASFKGTSSVSHMLPKSEQYPDEPDPDEPDPDESDKGVQIKKVRLPRKKKIVRGR